MFLIAVMTCALLRAVAQTPGTGAISGMVTDPASRAVANADVTTVNEATRIARAGSTNAEGSFRVPLLTPGLYTVRIKASGFAEAVQREVQVTASETRTVNVKLRVETASTTVQVSEGGEVAQLESSTLGGLVDETAIGSLPLSNRNYTQILGLSPGVSVPLPNAAELGHGTQNVAANGGKTTANNIQFNGIDANNLAQNSAANDNEEVGTAIPAPDAIQEFRVQTANFDAAYGRGSGANVDLVTKAGSSRFHGSAWEFVRNNLFNANEFFLKQEGAPRPDLKQNQFGASLGGPVLKGRTFFFLEYQGLTEVNGLGGKQTATLPLLTQDRSAKTLGAQFCPAGHVDGTGQPLAGYLTHAGGTQVACDGSNINPVALAILNTKLANGRFAVPSPQITLPAGATGALPVGQSTFAIPAHYREDQFAVNLDEVMSAKNTVSGRFFYSRAPTSKPFSPSAANVPGWGTEELDRNTLFVLGDTHIFSSTLVNVARIGFARYDGIAKVQNPILASAVGEGTPTGVASATAGAPGLTIDGLFTIGDAGTPSQWQVTNTFVWQDTVSLTRGRHNLRLGGEFKRHQVDEDAPFTTDGLLDISTFSDFLLGMSADQNGSPIGSSNVTTSFAGGGIYRRDTRYNDVSVFAQDDVKLMPRLTVNAGVRYEIFGAPMDTHGRLANFDPAIAAGQVPDTGTFSGMTVPSNFAGTVPQGVVRTGYPGLWRTPLGDVSPRLGFAWQMSSRPVLVLRGGYGLYYDRHSGNIAETTLGQAPFSTLQIQSGPTNAGATLQQPFVPQVPPVTSYPVFTPRVPFGFPFIQGTDPNVADPRTQEYNLNVQYAFAKEMLLQVGYVGTRSSHRAGQVEFNQALLASPSGPVNGETTNSTNNLISRLPFAGVSPGSLLTTSLYRANYNSLQTSVTRRMRGGFQFGASYTWAKALDETSGSGGSPVFELYLATNDQRNPRQAYGLADTDRSQRAVLNFTWTVPPSAWAPAPLRLAMKDWQFSGIGVAQSGSPLTITDNNAGSVYGNLSGQTRAQRTGSNPSTKGSLFDRVGGHYLDAAAFTAAP
ncbi:MAG TPA: TonB-dependent receptor, partial [Acidobacteriaceae bacterium]|nr:TonB-dependent receptor [Acidobacteriaceae bacterium]